MMKTIILILNFFVLINLSAQEQSKYRLEENQSYDSVIQFKAKDKLANALNSELKERKSNFSFIRLKKKGNYWIYILVDKKEILGLKNNSSLITKSELFIYDLKSELLLSVNYDDSNHTSFEKRNNKYYCKFYLPYDDIDSVDIFNSILKPLFSIKFTSGSFILIDKPLSHNPFCVYNYEMKSFYYFNESNKNAYFELKELNVSDLYQKIRLLIFDDKNNVNKFNVRFENRLLSNQ